MRMSSNTSELHHGPAPLDDVVVSSTAICVGPAVGAVDGDALGVCSVLLLLDDVGFGVGPIVAIPARSSVHVHTAPSLLAESQMPTLAWNVKV
jgi:hypothetical protein